MNNYQGNDQGNLNVSYQGINSFYVNELTDNEVIYDLNSNMMLPNLNLAEPSKSLYLSEDIFVKYFDVILLRNLQTFHDSSLNMCPLKSLYITDYFITLDFVNFTYKIPEILKMSIESCKITNTRFYVIPLRLNLNYKSAHSNLIIVDTQFNTIEFFEPHGNKFNGSEHELPYNIERHIKILISKLFPIKSLFYNFRNVQNSCPRGLQAMQNSINPNSGHCLAWSLLFINLRILNLAFDTNYIIDYLHKNTPEQLDLYIRRYIGYLENTSHLLEKKLYPTVKYNMLLSEEELENIKNRIKFLLVNYTNLSLTIDKTPKDFVNINKYFEELISYHKIKNFNNIFFKYFNKYALNNNYNLSYDSDDSDDSDALESPKHENLPEELNLDGTDTDTDSDTDSDTDNITIDKKRKASSSPTFSDFSNDSKDSDLDELYSNYH